MDGGITISNENKKRKQVTVTEIVEEKRYGTSDFLRIPKSWRSLQGLQGHLICEAKVEKDENGIWFLIFKKLTEPCRQT